MAPHGSVPNIGPRWEANPSHEGSAEGSVEPVRQPGKLEGSCGGNLVAAQRCSLPVYHSPCGQTRSVEGRLRPMRWGGSGLLEALPAV